MTDKQTNPPRKKTNLSFLRSSLGTRLTLSMGLLITVTSLFLFVGIYRREEKQRIEQINTQAEALLSEMLVAREWVSSYNGVWTTNPGDYYLKEENGYFQKSPAMVTKELSNLSDNKGYYRFHITSLILTNPENTPDDFEHGALLQFEKEPVPISSIDRAGEEPVYRLMIPLKVAESCLECHENQGYQTGDIRGGLSVLVPINKMDASLANSRRILISSALGIVSLVMVVLYFMVRRMIISPVGQLKEVAISIGEGNYDARCNLNTGDELEVFGQTLNQMVENLKRSQDSLKERVAQRTQELDTISEVALIISRAGALENVLQEALEKVVSASDATGGLIQLFEEENARVAAHTGLFPKIVNCFRHVPQKKDTSPEIRLTQEAIQVRNIDTGVCKKLFPNIECPKEDCHAIVAEYARMASVLLKSRSRSLGTIILFSKKETSFSPEIMQLLESIGNQLGVAIENANFHQHIEQIAVLEERARISRELHDSLAQTLGWLSIKTEMLEEDLKLGEIEKSNTEMKAIRRVVRDACYDVRESIDGLRTRPTGDLTATAAAWISEFRQRSGLITDFRAMDSDVPLSPRVETELLRILQESLTNVRKHAKAKRVQIDLQVKDSFAELKIKDDGCGFNYQADQDAGHFGLRIMQERAEKLKGSFHIDATPDKGTRIKVTLPLYPSM
ncbi:MAG: hypothetical protein B6I38_04685 [Anaerolineaceae bacterium 4572_5.1]|nr:MAG: hypothetical protein B6I38_04685 [Anaerolineaceae bacterium 4572_5.1]